MIRARFSHGFVSSSRARALVGAVVVAALGCASTALADRLVAKGAALSGSVKAMTAAGVEFQPDFAKDSMLVPWDNVEDLSTEATYQVLYGEESETTAPVKSYHDGHLVVGDAEVEPKALISAAAMEGESPAFADRARAAFRYWHGGVNVGFNLQQATTDNLGALFAFHALRSNGPTRLMLGVDYRYATERDPSSPPPREKRTKDAVSGLVRGEYDLSKNFYLYGTTDALYDAIQNLSLRAVPKAGVGYVLWQREPKEGVRDFLQIEAGAGWVYEKYIYNGDDIGDPAPDLGDDDYFTVAFGAAAAVLLPRGAAFDWRFDWLPAVDDFTGDYVVRTTAGLTIPLIAPLSARMSVADTYDSTPSAGSEKNSLYLDTSLSLGW